ncbi:MAG TPA: hypothetical protein VKP69_03325 [Isosphaeraceae bacterium]|nr:hypothetical protein [Isosphaeraceae bacterium]
MGPARPARSRAIACPAGPTWPAGARRSVGRSLGWGPGAFLASDAANRASASEVAVAASAVSRAVRGMRAQRPEGWTGTATDQRNHLVDPAVESATRAKDGPKAAKDTGGEFDPFSRGRLQGGDPRAAGPGRRWARPPLAEPHPIAGPGRQDLLPVGVGQADGRAPRHPPKPERWRRRALAPGPGRVVRPELLGRLPAPRR